MDIQRLLYKEIETEVEGANSLETGLGIVVVEMYTEWKPTLIGRILRKRAKVTCERYLGRVGGPWYDLALCYRVGPEMEGMVDGYYLNWAEKHDKISSIYLLGSFPKDQ